jgi:hypothetical protein
MKIIIFVFAGLSGKTVFLQKIIKILFLIFQKWTFINVLFSKMDCTLFLIFLFFLIHTEVLNSIDIILYCKAYTV